MESLALSDVREQRDLVFRLLLSWPSPRPASITALTLIMAYNANSAQGADVAAVDGDVFLAVQRVCGHLLTGHQLVAILRRPSALNMAALDVVSAVLRAGSPELSSLTGGCINALIETSQDITIAIVG